MAFVHPNPGEEIIADHVRQLTLSAAGSSGGGQIWKLIDLTDAVNPALSVRNQSLTGTALRVYNGTADLLTVVNNGANSGYVTIAGLAQGGPQTFDVEAYGAVGDGTTDDTDAIQDCIDAAVAAVAPGPPTNYYGAVVRFTSPQYAVSALDVTDSVHNILFQGVAGSGGVIISGIKQTSATHSSTGKAVFDCAGSQAISFENILVNATGVDGSHVTPMAGWLFAGTGATGTNCAANRMTNCGSFGPFQVAPLVTTYSGAHVFVGCGWQQYQIDRPAVLVGNVFPSSCGTLTSLTSDTFPPTVSGSGGGSNTFVACEAHHMPASGGFSAPFGNGNGCALLIQDADSIRWDGGILASYGAAVWIVNGTTGSVDIHPATVYSDDGTSKPSYIAAFGPSAAVAMHDYSGGVLYGVPLNTASGALIRLGGNAVVTNLRFHGYAPKSFPTSAKAVSAAAYSANSTEAIVNGIIDANSLAIPMTSSGSGPSLGNGITWARAGAVTLDAGAHNYSPVTQPSCVAVRTTDVSLTSGAFTALSFESATNTTDTMWVIGSPTRVTIATPGAYDLAAFCRFAANGTGARYLGIQKNGGTTLIDTWEAANATQVAIVAVSIPGVVLAAGDYLELIPSQDSGGGLNALAAGGGPQLYARRRKE